MSIPHHINGKVFVTFVICWIASIIGLIGIIRVGQSGCIDDVMPILAALEVGFLVVTTISVTMLTNKKE